MSIFKVVAQGDTMYIEAENQETAAEKLRTVCGEIPDHLLDWSEVAEAPEGETIL